MVKEGGRGEKERGELKVSRGVSMAGKNMKKRMLINGPTMFPRGAVGGGR